MGLAKESMDAMAAKGSGLSFADLLADYGGIRFERWLADPKEGAARLAGVAEGFRGAEFLPDPSGEVEGLMMAEFEKRFGSMQDERFLREKRRILDALEALPVYRPSAGSKEGGAGGEDAKPGGAGEGKAK
jgi:hypothetical protein